MPFRSRIRRDVRWAPETGAGLEHLHLETTAGDGVLGRSVVAGTFGGIAFGASYEIELDDAWRVRRFAVETVAGLRLSLDSPEPGLWRDPSGAHRADLDGCIDIDLSATPFTNTLPIRRLDLEPDDGETALTMLYVPADTLEPFPDLQHYTAIKAGKRYRFVNDDRSFVAELVVDEDGLVTDYPCLFKRL